MILRLDENKHMYECCSPEIRVIVSAGKIQRETTLDLGLQDKYVFKWLFTRKHQKNKIMIHEKLSVLV